MKHAILIGLSFSVLTAFASYSASAHAEPPVYGDWVTTEATAKLYREDRTVDYLHCELHFRFFPKDKSERDVRIENLSAKCQHPTYWDFNPKLRPGVIQANSSTANGFKAKIDVNGSIDFLEVRREGSGITLEWSERSFDDLNFDLSSGPMRLSPLRRHRR